MAGDLCSFSPLFPLIYMPCNNQYNNESALHVVFLPVGYASVFYPILLYFRRIPGVNCHLNAVHLIFPCYIVRGIFFLFRRVWMNWRPVVERISVLYCRMPRLRHFSYLFSVMQLIWQGLIGGWNGGWWDDGVRCNSGNGTVWCSAVAYSVM